MDVAATQLLVIIIAVVAVIAVIVVVALAAVFFITKVMLPRSRGRRASGGEE
jgi:hypothetical protein